MHAMVLETFHSQSHGEELERISCPCCGLDDAAVHRVSHDRLFGRPGNYRVLSCRACGMMYTNPRPTYAALGRHYPRDYFCYDPPETLRGLRGWVLRAATRSLVERRLRLLERVTGPLARGSKVCDVGCSHGQLLSAMQRRRGCDVMGVDFNEEMVEYGRGRGIPMALGTLKEVRFDDQEFDVVTMTEYLEHEPRPREVLQECRRILKPGGHLAVEIPLISTFGARLFGNYWSQLDLPRHLMFFTPQTLGRMLEETGYQVVSVKVLPGTIGMSLLHALGYENIGRMTLADMAATALATLPLLPILPLLREFMYVIARAEPSSESSYDSLLPPGVHPQGAPRLLQSGGAWSSTSFHST